MVTISTDIRNGPILAGMPEELGRRTMIRIVIVDDHPVTREGLKAIASMDRSITIVGEAGNAEQALSLINTTACDLLVLDLDLPDKNGLDFLRQLRAESRRIPVLILSAHSEDQFGVRAWRAGADGYLTKEASPGQLVEAIHKICSGGKYFSEAVRDQLLLFVRRKEGTLPHELLSEREFQVMSLIASGRTVSSIATELNLSVKTVSTYRARLLEKMELANNGEVTRYAIKTGLVG